MNPRDSHSLGLDIGAPRVICGQTYGHARVTPARYARREGNSLTNEEYGGPGVAITGEDEWT